jgi:hypothetical protein
MNVRDIIKTHALIEKVSVRERELCASASYQSNSNCARLNIFAYIMTPLKAEAGGRALTPSMYIAFSGKIFQLET